MAHARSEGAGDGAAAGDRASERLHTSVECHAEGGSGRRVPVDALGDGERAGRTLGARDRGGTRGAASEGVQKADQAGAVAAGGIESARKSVSSGIVRLLAMGNLWLMAFWASGLNAICADEPNLVIGSASQEVYRSGAIVLSASEWTSVFSSTRSARQSRCQEIRIHEQRALIGPALSLYPYRSSICPMARAHVANSQKQSEIVRNSPEK